MPSIPHNQFCRMKRLEGKYIGGVKFRTLKEISRNCLNGKELYHQAGMIKVC